MIHRELIDLKLWLFGAGVRRPCFELLTRSTIQSRANRKRYHAFGAQGGSILWPERRFQFCHTLSARSRLYGYRLPSALHQHQ